MNDEGRGENLIRQKSYDFALQVIEISRSLVRANEFVISKQLLRSGTSVGANVEEAQAAQSRADFVAKMSIASKEARESHYWLRLLRDSNSISPVQVAPLLREAESIVKILTSIVKSASTKK
ncbi:four helix bundle protein [Geoalkalibacter halelectricus]|uniref:Four helix bundle protein n=1 Tax=Geoalkalibacter halelectricus TaxID=2847045 RepID=A0ABY5ZM79_9BACT|nr:four helix bundle protein [Geoalkalibacter halelectricus]MDO3377825.1 four helix bundle protein [Geoalkalibacter halelectricus]UWZ79574.1 four helix bundle protein [Geoalkalibacter halelectricus]